MLRTHKQCSVDLSRLKLAAAMFLIAGDRDLWNKLSPDHRRDILHLYLDTEQAEGISGIDSWNKAFAAHANKASSR